MPLPDRLESLINTSVPCGYEWKYTITPAAPKPLFNGIVLKPCSGILPDKYSIPVNVQIDQKDLAAYPVSGDMFKMDNGTGPMQLSFTLNEGVKNVKKTYTSLDGNNLKHYADLNVDTNTGRIYGTISIDTNTVVDDDTTVLIPINLNSYNGNGLAVQPLVLAFYSGVLATSKDFTYGGQEEIPGIPTAATKISYDGLDALKNSITESKLYQDLKAAAAQALLDATQ